MQPQTGASKRQISLREKNKKKKIKKKIKSQNENTFENRFAAHQFAGPVKRKR